MAMALQGAALALEPLADWSCGKSTWSATAATIARGLRHRFRHRLAAAGLLHTYLLEPRRQRWLIAASRTGLLPFRPLYRLTH
jgi:hypothetical protein